MNQVSVIPRVNGALGFTLRTPIEDRTLAGEDELRSMLVVLLGGRAAEKLVFGTLHILRKTSTFGEQAFVVNHEGDSARYCVGYYFHAAGRTVLL